MMIDLDEPTNPECEQTGQQKNCANKPEEQENNPLQEERSKRKVRASLTQDLWQQYQKPTLSMKEKISIATLLVKLTDKRKAAKKALFT